jgi:hypothetical protein
VNKQAFANSVFLFMLLGGAAAFAATPGTFERVGDMTAPRGFATMTLLNDGTVLVAGGLRNSGPAGTDVVSQAAAERFDPKTNTFSAVGSMTYPRANHAAVRLQDGRVLVVGGSDDNFPATDQFTPGELIATAEIFDPATGKFTPTGDLITPRNNLTATLLASGKVLVAGGWNETPVETAETFDPATGKFTETGPMTLARDFHEAVALSDGRVALLGGIRILDNINTPQRSVEIYDPTTNAFSPAGQMAEPRSHFHAALLPDGRILAAGGSGPNPGGRFFSVSRSVEIYDPATGQSTITDQMPDTRFNHTAATLADGRVLVIGGQHSNDATDPNIRLSSAVLIDPVTGKVTPTGNMSTGRQNGPAASLLPDGRVLVIGGKPGNITAEVYVP